MSVTKPGCEMPASYNTTFTWSNDVQSAGGDLRDNTDVLYHIVVEAEGFEPTQTTSADLQSALALQLQRASI